MKRILGLAALLGQSMALAAGFHVAPGHRGANKRPVRYYASARPTDARWWHTLADLGSGHHPDAHRQLTVLNAAQAKRQRRAEKLQQQTFGMWNNLAHITQFAIPGGGTAKGFPPRLNPFYQPPVTE